MSVRVGVLDYGSGNLHSACRALESAGASVVLAGPGAELEACDKLVLPGVGAFAACMEQLRSVRGDEFVRAWVDQGRPLLGICVGHQVLFEAGSEHGVESVGLGLLPGRVERLASPRLPHMGWNTVESGDASGLLDGVASERFYFVHSYGVRSHTGLDELGARVVTASHGGDQFVAAVEHGAVCSTQFHPEKSGSAGGRLLRNWLLG